MFEGLRSLIMQRTAKVFKMVKNVWEVNVQKAGWHFRHLYCDPRLTLLAVDAQNAHVKNPRYLLYF